MSKHTALSMNDGLRLSRLMFSFVLLIKLSSRRNGKNKSISALRRRVDCSNDKYKKCDISNIL